VSECFFFQLRVFVSPPLLLLVGYSETSLFFSFVSDPPSCIALLLWLLVVVVVVVAAAALQFTGGPSSVGLEASSWRQQQLSHVFPRTMSAAAAVVSSGGNSIPLVVAAASLPAFWQTGIFLKKV
jgi:hypothetical protein